MLEGQEIEEIFFHEIIHNKDERIDSDFWVRKPYKNPNLIYKKIGECLIGAQYGVSISMNEEKEGLPIYRMNEIHNMFCDFEVAKYARLDQDKIDSFKLNDKDVLFNRTNSYQWVGRTGIYRKLDNKDFMFASYLVRFIPDAKKITPEYLTVFLNSKYGVADVKRRSRPSINQTNVNPEEVKEIEIPLLKNKTQNKINELFDKSFDLMKRAREIYQNTEKYLLNVIGLKNYDYDSNNYNIKSFKESFVRTGRLDAEYYSKKYENILKFIHSNKHETLSKLVNIKKSIEPGSEAYSDEEGLPFLRVADFNKLGITKPQKNLSPPFVIKNKTKLAQLKLKKNIIIFSKDGSVGQAYCLQRNEDIVTSSAILHLSIIDNSIILPNYLTLVLNSMIVQMQAEKDAGGSIILHWRVNEIENIVIPLIDIEIQKNIDTKICESFRLKNKSEELLQIAKKSVEIAIEKNETIAMEYLDSELKLIQYI